MKKKRILRILITVFMLTSLMACTKKNDNTTDQITSSVIEDNDSNEAENEPKVEIAGWSIEVSDYRIDTSMENVSVVLGYTNVGSNTFSKTAAEGNEFCLVHLNIEKKDSKEIIDWDKFILVDDLGNTYNRMDDSFLTELGMKRMPGTDLNFGANAGWIAYEIKQGYSDLKLSYQFEYETYGYNLLGTSADQTKNELAPEYVSHLEEQKKIDDNLLAEAKNGFTLDNPLVVVNPYGISPLSAIAIFDTATETKVELNVKGKKPQDDIKVTFDKAKTHILPIYGLYAGDTTEVVFKLDDGTEKSIEISTDKVDTTLLKAEVTAIDKNEYDFSKFTFAAVQSENTYGVAAYDSSGDARLLLEGKSFPVKRLKNGNIMISAADIIHGQYYSTGVYEMDLCGRIINEYIIPGGYHHDFFELDNGNLLVASDAVEFSTVEDQVYEIDRNTGEVVYELDLTGFLDVNDGGSINRTEEDWFHNNSVWYDKATDNIILSGRHVDAVIAINKTNKTLNWILGDPNGWNSVDKSLFFTPVGNKFEWQYAQHNATVLPNGNILLFDNGAGRTKVGAEDKKVTGDAVYSRAVIYDIDTDNMTIEQVWQYGKERGEEWYSSFISGAEYLDDNNIWVTSGGTLYNPETNNYDVPLNELTTSQKIAHLGQVKNGKLVFELKLDHLTYRSTRLPMYPENYSLDMTVAGKYLGDLGETPGIDVSGFDLNTAKAADFPINITKKPERYIVNGSWASTAEDAAVILKGSNGTMLGYSIAKPAVNTGNAETVNFNTWFSPVGFEDQSYDVFIRNSGVIYNTGYVIK